MKLKLRLPKLSFGTITSGLFILILIAELYVTFNYLYKNFQPSPVVISDEKIIKADLKGYSQIYADINNRRNYEAEELIYQNSNPFKFGE